MLEILFVWIVLGIIAGMIAASRGRSFFGWFVYGFLIPPVAIVHAILIDRGDSVAAKRLAAGTHKTCPFCAEQIRAVAVVCPHCRRDLPKAAPRRAPGQRDNWLQNTPRDRFNWPEGKP